MRLVFVAASLVAWLALGSPGVATAQPKRSPAAAPAPTSEPAATQAAPRDVAVPREVAAPREAAPKSSPRSETVRGEGTASDEQSGKSGAVRRPPSGSGGSPAQPPRDHAVARTGPPPRDYDGDRHHNVYYHPSYYGYSPYYYNPYYYSGFHFGYLAYSPWGWSPAFYGYPYPVGGWVNPGYDYGSIRIKVKHRDAEVYVDGYYAGTVDDFDGTFQSLKLEAGGYKVEIRKPGFETLYFDVHVQPDRTITYRGTMRPDP